MMSGLILSCMINCESDVMFPSLVEIKNSVSPYICKSCVAVMKCFASLVEATMICWPCFRSWRIVSILM